MARAGGPFQPLSTRVYETNLCKETEYARAQLIAPHSFLWARTLTERMRLSV